MLICISQEALTGPSDLMVCFGTWLRLHNVNTSLNSKPVIQRRSKRSLMGKLLFICIEFTMYIHLLLDSAAVAASYMISLVCYLPSLFQYEDRPVLGYPFTPGNDWWGHTLSYMYVPKTNQYWISYSFFLLVSMKIIPTLAVIIMNTIMIINLNQLKLRKRYTKHSELSTQGATLDVSTISGHIEGTNQKKLKGKNRIAKRITKIADDIKTGKVLILISSFYIFFTFPHTVDQFYYLIYQGDCVDLKFK